MMQYGNVFVSKGVNSNIEAVIENDVGTLIKKSEDKQIIQELNLTSSIEAPVTKEQKLGELKFIQDDNVIASVNVIANTDSNKINLGSITKKIFFSWIDLLRNSNV